jgi:hypothetical protein
VESYILIQTEVGRAEDVARQVAGMEGIVMAETVTGPYDVITRAWTATESVLLHEVEDAIKAIPSVVRIVACPMTPHDRVWEMGREPAASGVPA